MASCDVLAGGEAPARAWEGSEEQQGESDEVSPQTLPAQEAPLSGQQQKGSSSSRRHHLLKYDLTAKVSEAARAFFGNLPPEEAGAVIWRLQQRELRDNFITIYQTRTVSCNNKWLRGKLLQAVGLDSRWEPKWVRQANEAREAAAAAAGSGDTAEPTAVGNVGRPLRRAAAVAPRRWGDSSDVDESSFGDDSSVVKGGSNRGPRGAGQKRREGVAEAPARADVGGNAAWGNDSKRPRFNSVGGNLHMSAAAEYGSGDLPAAPHEAAAAPAAELSTQRAQPMAPPPTFSQTSAAGAAGVAGAAAHSSVLLGGDQLRPTVALPAWLQQQIEAALAEQEAVQQAYSHLGLGQAAAAALAAAAAPPPAAAPVARQNALLYWQPDGAGPSALEHAVGAVAPSTLQHLAGLAPASAPLPAHAHASQTLSSLLCQPGLAAAAALQHPAPAGRSPALPQHSAVWQQLLAPAAALPSPHQHHQQQLQQQLQHLQLQRLLQAQGLDLYGTAAVQPSPAPVHPSPGHTLASVQALLLQQPALAQPSPGGRPSSAPPGYHPGLALHPAAAAAQPPLPPLQPPQLSGTELLLLQLQQQQQQQQQQLRLQQEAEQALAAANAPRAFLQLYEEQQRLYLLKQQQFEQQQASQEQQQQQQQQALLAAALQQAALQQHNGMAPPAGQQQPPPPPGDGMPDFGALVQQQQLLEQQLAGLSAQQEQPAVSTAVQAVQAVKPQPACDLLDACGPRQQHPSPFAAEAFAGGPQVLQQQRAAAQQQGVPANPFAAAAAAAEAAHALSSAEQQREPAAAAPPPQQAADALRALPSIPPLALDTLATLPSLSLAAMGTLGRPTISQDLQSIFQAWEEGRVSMGLPALSSGGLLPPS